VPAASGAAGPWPARRPETTALTGRVQLPSSKIDLLADGPGDKLQPGTKYGKLPYSSLSVLQREKKCPKLGQNALAESDFGAVAMQPAASC
jgi:hypothetical protein